MIPKRPFSRAEKSLFILAGGGIFLLVGIGAFNVSRNAIPDIVIPPSPAIPNPNGFDLYIAAAKSVVRANPPVDAINDTQKRIPAEAAKLYSLKRKSAWLQSNSTGFALFNKATKTSTSYPASREMKTPPVGYLREMARFKVVEANVYMLQKQPAKATDSALDIIQMGTDISQNADLIGMIVGNTIKSLGTNYFERNFDIITSLKAVEAKAATKRLEVIIARNPRFLQAVQQERWAHISNTLKLVREYPRSEWAKLFYEEGLRTYLKSQFLSPGMIIERQNQEYDEFEAYLKTPYSASKYRQAQKLYEDKNEPKLSVRPMFAGAQFSEAKSRVTLNLLLARLALRAYCAERNSYPADLQALVPNYLKAVPIDDFGNGKPLRYRRSGNEYVLWSIGPDSKDDNGKAVQGKTAKTSQRDGIFPESLGDFVAGKNY